MKKTQTTGFDKDGRIKFVGTVYDQELLKKFVKMRLPIFMDMSWRN